MSERRVVLICGAPGSGKSTLARSLGLDVYDRDDDRWLEHDFMFALAQVGRDPNARAAVIRTGATFDARRAAIALVRPTEVVVLETPAFECVRRIVARKRTSPSVRAQIAAARDWHRAYAAESERQDVALGHRSRTW